LKAHRPERYRGTVGSGAVAKALTPEEQAEAEAGGKNVSDPVSDSESDTTETGTI